jgi:hypothetical protein
VYVKSEVEALAAQMRRERSERQQEET